MKWTLLKLWYDVQEASSLEYECVLSELIAEYIMDKVILLTALNSSKYSNASMLNKCWETIK